jgi:hypothetical protein
MLDAMLLREPTFHLKPVVRFREFPFGTIKDVSMRGFMAAEPWENQDRVVAYLRSGVILAYPMGADLMDWFDKPNRANPLIDGKQLGGATPLTDGEWWWPAGLIHFIQKYNVRVPAEFIEHAAQQNWRVDQNAVSRCHYDFSYSPAEQARMAGKEDSLSSEAR